MSKKNRNDLENDARQSGADRPAFGEDERDFGADGQRVDNPGVWENPPRDADRDSKVRAANPDREDKG